MKIRKPDDAEHQQIIKFSPESMHEGTLGEVRPTHDKMEQLIDSLLEKGCSYLIAVEDDELIGWVLFGASRDQLTNKTVGFIYELFVMEEFRGNGLSKHLITDAIEYLKIEGYSEVRLNVFANNFAIKLYERMGFTPKNITMKLDL